MTGIIFIVMGELVILLPGGGDCAKIYEGDHEDR